MAVLRINDFGGEYPSVDPRNLPANGAQTNRNLYALTNDFRPLKTDSATGAFCTNGTKSMHRFARSVGGAFNQNFASGWITSTIERSYVKGQINDDRTERTYTTFDDGSSAPRVIDVTGQDRQLGVPAPTKPTVTAAVVDELTSAEAEELLSNDVVDAIRRAVALSINRNEPACRTNNGVSYGGPYSFNGLSQADATYPTQFQTLYWSLFAVVPQARISLLGLDATRLNAITVGDATVAGSGAKMYVPITALPATSVVIQSVFDSTVAAVKNPANNTQLLPQATIDVLRQRTIDALNPTTLAKSQRDELEALTKEFYQILLTNTPPTVSTAPVQSSYTYLDGTTTRALPTKPAGAEYLDDGSGALYRSAAWANYDAAVASYNAAASAYNTAATKTSTDYASINNRLVEIQQKAAAATRAVESAVLEAQTRLMTATAEDYLTYLNSIGGSAGLNITTVDRIVESRFYVVTHVTDWGEESAPSPVSNLVEADQNDGVTVALPSVPSGRYVTKWRIYRSNTASDTTAFQFVEELATGTTTYTDSKKFSQLGETLPTTAWAEPPSTLRGLVGLPNGIMAGFFDNTVAFCEPYAPYAWPVEYQVTTEFPIVGMAVFGSTLFVGTIGNPYFVGGADSASMSAVKLDSNQSCVSRRSIVAVQGGVLYASPDGLCLADQNGVNVISSGWYTREDWQALNPSSMFAVENERVYYLFYYNGTKGCLTFDLAARKLGRIDLSATAAFCDRLNDRLFIANGTSIQEVFGGSTRRTGLWKSGKGTLPAQMPLAWIKVLGQQSDAAPVTVRWYGDGTLRATLTFTNTEPKRLPAGRFLEHEVEVESAARVTSVTLASTTQEFQSV